MATDNVKKMVGNIFNEIADAMETGTFGAKVRVGLTTFGSELGVENMVKGAEMAQKKSQALEVVLIGPKTDSSLTQIVVDTEDQGYSEMERLLDSGELDACVTLHYNFPIGVSTVGRVTTPGRGRDMIIATTTGTSSAHRVEAMVKNGIYGIIAAKALGIKEPTVGILNVDGARQAERAFNELSSKGYKINITESERADGGAVMRGNDLLTGTPDVMVTDTLTGNIIMKVFSSFMTGGSYESVGYGYGPGIGEGYDRLVMILSRASGVPVVANAILYAAELVQGEVQKVAKQEFEAANKAGLKEILASLSKETKKEEVKEPAKAPDKEPVTGTIEGIDIMELEDAVQVLWESGIYAESGMGCTGPIVMVNETKIGDAVGVLSKSGYAVDQTENC
ncbi:MAG: glycine/sarcosine/betaine reductase complex component C subunit alpha [Gudongella sp.]|jgi:glycine reductase|nr:glycine/sarcosine/betaine reductase complex component C subunit alpha [Gudongella sp.]